MLYWVCQRVIENEKSGTRLCKDEFPLCDEPRTQPEGAGVSTKNLFWFPNINVCQIQNVLTLNLTQMDKEPVGHFVFTTMFSQNNTIAFQIDFQHLKNTLAIR